MAGFAIVILPFILAGIAAAVVMAVAIAVIALDWGISLAVIMNAERKKQKKLGNKPIAQTVMMIYGILLAVIPAGLAAYVIINKDNLSDGVVAVGGILLATTGITVPFSVLCVVLFYVFMVIAGITLIVIGNTERKKLRLRNEKHFVPIFMIVYGIVIAAIPVCTALFLGGTAWYLGLLSEQAVFLF